MSRPGDGWGRRLAVLGLTAGKEVTESQLRNLFVERGRHPCADQIEADRLAKGDSPTPALSVAGCWSRVSISSSGRSRRSTCCGRWG